MSKKKPGQAVDVGESGRYSSSMNTERGDTARHPIRVVSRRTGLTPALLRAWEKRYGVVTPSRQRNF